MIKKASLLRLLAIFAVVATWLEVWLARTDLSGKESFKALGDLRMSPAFADLRALTSAANCSSWQSQVLNGADMSCDLYGRFGDLGYPPFSVAALSVFGITEASTGLVAVALATVFLGLISWIFLFRSKKSLLSRLMLLVTVTGFPTLLALERMNIDIPIFICLIGVSLLLDSSPSGRARQALKNFLVFTLSASIVSWKVYPIFGLAILAAAKTPRSAGIEKWRWISLIAGTLAGLASIAPWMLQAEDIPNPGLGIISHGFLGAELPEKISAALIVLTCIWISWSRQRDHSTKNQKYWQQKIATIKGLPSLYLSCTATWVACFILTRSYDYRLIFIYPAIAYVCRLEPSNRSHKTMKNIGLVIFSMLMIVPIIYFPLDSANLGLLDLISNPALKNLTTLPKILAWWIGRILDLGGTTVMAVLICFTMASTTESISSK